MQASDGCKNLAMWALWTLYICLALALSIARSDGPKGQGFSSVRVESLLSKMTLEDKVKEASPSPVSRPFCLDGFGRLLLLLLHLGERAPCKVCSMKCWACYGLSALSILLLILL